MSEFYHRDANGGMRYFGLRCGSCELTIEHPVPSHAQSLCKAARLKGQAEAVGKLVEAAKDVLRIWDHPDSPSSNSMNQLRAALSNFEASKPKTNHGDPNV